VFNTEHERAVLTQSLRNSGDIDNVLESLYFVIQNHTPFALYVATADRSNCTWIFDPDMVYEMLGGEDIHIKTFRTLFTDDIERGEGILFYVLRKVGPVVTIRLGESTIRSVIEELETTTH
jgi:hypothetical protein